MDEGAIGADERARDRVAELGYHAASQKALAKGRSDRERHERGRPHDERLGESQRAKQPS